jgi:hypothetical protein
MRSLCRGQNALASISRQNYALSNWMHLRRNPLARLRRELFRPCLSSLQPAQPPQRNRGGIFLDIRLSHKFSMPVTPARLKAELPTCYDYSVVLLRSVRQGCDMAINEHTICRKGLA